MKKLFCGVLAAVAAFALGASPVISTVSAAPSTTAEDWDLTRATIEYTDEGIQINQTEMGTPDNHAIAILEVPFTNLDSFEIKFKITMDYYVATGRNANDVWTAVNIMGVPAFFNWRNSESYGWAKDTPGLVTRFFNYDDDLRLITDVYQEGYKTAGEDPSSQVVDTWTCLNASASASIEQDVTLKFAWETLADDASKSFYSMYVNGNKISTSDELAFVDREVLFPEDKIYLTVIMNTQDKESNDLSSVVIKEINGVSMAPENANVDNNDGSGNGAGQEKKGCGAVIGSSAFVGLVIFGACALALKKKED